MSKKRDQELTSID